ncbi:MAG: single-stranded DNA-binding protein, partial [Opitutales bacterium]|nr:single-stranded DNA-binding protein [Opitutales bacterium]
ESRSTQSGTSVCKLGLAVSRVYSTKDGERKEETTFVDIDAFGKQAEVITKYMRKGKAIHVEGRLKLDQWEGNDGQKRSKLGVVLENFQFVGGRDDGDSSSGSSYEKSSPPARESKPASSTEDSLDDDVPF